jgi:(p)ppGpp synthase/HD superfamily hydrolase
MPISQGDHDLIQKACLFASVVHGDQKRTFSGRPYISHCEEVAILVDAIDAPAAVIAAAWLHDTIEDCGVTFDFLCKTFGEDVAQLVFQVTNQGKTQDGDRKALIDLNHLALASAHGQTIKLADICSNCSTVVADAPAQWAAKYLRGKIEQLKVLIKGDSRLQMRARGIINRGCNQLGLSERSKAAA